MGQSRGIAQPRHRPPNSRGARRHNGTPVTHRRVHFVYSVTEWPTYRRGVGHRVGFRAPDPRWPATHPTREASTPLRRPVGQTPPKPSPRDFWGCYGGSALCLRLGLATMALTVSARNTMLDALAGSATTASLHFADPGTAGTSEVSGGTYARKPITWNGAAGGSLQSAAGPAFDVPAATTVTHFGLWNAAGTFLGASPLSATETFGAAGTYTLTAATVGLT